MNCLVVVGIWLTSLSQAQDTAMKQLNTVEIQAQREVSYMAGTQVLKIDTAILKAYRQSSLAELLTQQTGVFIKSYSAGGLSSTALRGASASQTAVVWNGINLQSPMLGQVDMSLLNLQTIENVQIEYGSAASSHYGSGAVAGAIVLNTKPIFKPGLTVDAGYTTGSYGLQQAQAHVAMSSAKLAFTASVFSQFISNNYPYKDPDKGNNLFEQRNATVKQNGYLLETYFKLSERQRIGAKLWQQMADRGIPPSLSQSNSEAKQQDAFFRALLDWQRIGDAVTWKANTGYLNEVINYYDKPNLTQSESQSQSWQTNLTGQAQVNRTQTADFGVTSLYTQAVSTGATNGQVSGYQLTPSRNQQAVYGAYRYTSESKRFSTSATARQELLQGKAVPFIPGLGIDFHLNKAWSFRGSANRSYRIPTFNDLYWAQGGNPNLLPEEGWSEEAGVAYKRTQLNYQLSADFAFYNRDIKNWIIWLPSDNGFFSPQNVTRVLSRGVELQLRTQVTLTTEWKVHFSAMTTYVSSVNQQAKSANDESVGKQLIYVPKWSMQTNVGFDYRRLYVNYNFCYTDMTYTTSDNQSYLPSYRISNVQLGYTFPMKKLVWQLNAQLNNLLGESYQVIASRPMPLENYRLGIILKFNTYH